MRNIKIIILLFVMILLQSCGSNMRKSIDFLHFRNLDSINGKYLQANVYEVQDINDNNTKNKVICSKKEYNNKGLIIKGTNYTDKDEPKYSVYYTYNDNNQKVEIKSISENEITYIFNYEYNNKNQNVLFACRFPTLNTKEDVKTEYNEMGKPIKETRIINNINLKATESDVINTEVYNYSAVNGLLESKINKHRASLLRTVVTKSIYEYDSNNNKVKETESVGNDANIVSIHTYKYDANRNIIEHIIDYPKSKKLQKCIYEYNDKNKILNYSEFDINDVLTSKIEFTYNADFNYNTVKYYNKSENKTYNWIIEYN